MFQYLFALRASIRVKEITKFETTVRTFLFEHILLPFFEPVEACSSIALSKNLFLSSRLLRSQPPGREKGVPLREESDCENAVFGARGIRRRLWECRIVSPDFLVVVVPQVHFQRT
ncbi:MAG TPA: hypothetical protein VKY92_22970 [Verrucomicrobiae bacterium]|jgi:hypothetical protein|nr:hypothetical protein [Verrucomicrobiae bacterium]